jgi:baseplate J-like protein
VTGPAGGDGARLEPPEIVYLEVDDEITSAAARLRRIEAERIAFVLPYGSRLATSRINFRLLAREAAGRGKRLEIVAADASARALAGSAGLVVHASVAALERGDEGGPAAGEATGSVEDGAAQADGLATVADGTEARVLKVPGSAEKVPIVGRPRPPVRTRTAAIVGLVIVALLAVGGFAAYSFLPSATIVLTPAAETIGPLQLTVEARPDVTTPDPATLTVPATTYSFGISTAQTYTTTGVKVTETKARGNVTFRNCDPSSAVIIPAGSKVATASGVQFETLARLSIHKASFQPPSTVNCRTGSVSIEALAAGTAGNVAADLIRQVPPGYDSSLLFVTNPQPTSGGTHDETPQVSQADIDAAMLALNAALATDLEAQIAQATGVPPGTTLLEATKTLGTPTPSVEPSTLVGKALTQFDLGLDAQGTVLGVATAAVEDVATARLTDRVGDGWQIAEDSTKVDVGTPIVAAGVVQFPVSATATRFRVVDREALLAQVRGLVLAEARSRLDDYGVVEITLWPDWVTTIPSDTGRISFTVNEAAPTPGPSGSTP